MNLAKPKTRIASKLRKIKQWAKTVKSQEQLNAILLPIKNPFQRRACFNMLEPWLTFPAHYPSSMIIQRDQEQSVIQTL